ncbi:hypothetical protein [Halegenticoccus tardaugens]|uniref:hypothetical protein n=1 Tax=Halegenticoccus tardaugens TaxID=2071624 RepID=UPI00100B6794|nr:hypothetical protein [Halegenticoccus tardaugens]
MSFTSTWCRNLCVGKNRKLLGAALIGALGGLIVTSNPIIAYDLPLFGLVLALAFGGAVFFSYSGGGLLEAVTLLFGPAVGFYAYNCSGGWGGDVYLLPFPELLFICPVAYAPPPALDIVASISIGIALPLGAVAVGCGRYLQKRH